MTEHLTAGELVALVNRAFPRLPADRRLAILVDLPDEALGDNPAWAERRAMAAQWAGLLAASTAELDLVGVSLLAYRNVRANNAELPATAWDYTHRELPATADALAGEERPFSQWLAEHQIVIAPTELSATAPLKLLARTLDLRAATMPGFAASMIPALRLDYGLIGRRVDTLKALLDRACRCELDFLVDGQTRHHLALDLRHRSSHASGGLFPEPGVAGNLPSGEAYIVPYEGERDGDPSRSEGHLPVELEGEVVLYRIARNQAVQVESTGPRSDGEAARLVREPAYGNLAELGLGVLGDLGLQPVGEVLLDEKLGLHIAFGRSDHFGGQVGPSRFSSPEQVVHIDRVYVPALQPRIVVARAVLGFADGSERLLMVDGSYPAAIFAAEDAR